MPGRSDLLVLVRIFHALFLRSPLTTKTILACAPLLVTTGYIRLRVVVLKDKKNKKEHEESAQLACEAAGSIRTVASLTREDDCTLIYSKALEEPLRKSNKTAIFSNGLYALSQALSFFVIALVFWYGSRLVANFEFGVQAFFVGLMVSNILHTTRTVAHTALL